MPQNSKTKTNKSKQMFSYDEEHFIKCINLILPGDVKELKYQIHFFNTEYYSHCYDLIMCFKHNRHPLGSFLAEKIKDCIQLDEHGEVVSCDEVAAKRVLNEKLCEELRECYKDAREKKKNKELEDAIAYVEATKEYFVTEWVFQFRYFWAISGIFSKKSKRDMSDLEKMIEEFISNFEKTTEEGMTGGLDLYAVEAIDQNRLGVVSFKHLLLMCSNEEIVSKMIQIYEKAMQAQGCRDFAVTKALPDFYHIKFYNNVLRSFGMPIDRFRFDDQFRSDVSNGISKTAYFYPAVPQGFFQVNHESISKPVSQILGEFKYFLSYLSDIKERENVAVSCIKAIVCTQLPVFYGELQGKDIRVRYLNEFLTQYITEWLRPFVCCMAAENFVSLSNKGLDVKETLAWALVDYDSAFGIDRMPLFFFSSDEEKANFFYDDLSMLLVAAAQDNVILFSAVEALYQEEGKFERRLEILYRLCLMEEYRFIDRVFSGKMVGFDGIKERCSDGNTYFNELLIRYFKLRAGDEKESAKSTKNLIKRLVVQFKNSILRRDVEDDIDWVDIATQMGDDEMASLLRPPIYGDIWEARLRTLFQAGRSVSVTWVVGGEKETIKGFRVRLEGISLMEKNGEKREYSVKEFKHDLFPKIAHQLLPYAELKLVEIKKETCVVVDVCPGHKMLPEGMILFEKDSAEEKKANEEPLKGQEEKKKKKKRKKKKSQGEMGASGAKQERSDVSLRQVLIKITNKENLFEQNGFLANGQSVSGGTHWMYYFDRKKMPSVNTAHAPLSTSNYFEMLKEVCNSYFGMEVISLTLAEKKCKLVVDVSAWSRLDEEGIGKLRGLFDRALQEKELNEIKEVSLLPESKKEKVNNEIPLELTGTDRMNIQFHFNGAKEIIGLEGHKDNALCWAAYLYHAMRFFFYCSRITKQQAQGLSEAFFNCRTIIRHAFACMKAEHDYDVLNEMLEWSNKLLDKSQVKKEIVTGNNRLFDKLIYSVSLPLDQLKAVLEKINQWVLRYDPEHQLLGGKNKIEQEIKEEIEVYVRAIKEIEADTHASGYLRNKAKLTYFLLIGEALSGRDIDKLYKNDPYYQQYQYAKELYGRCGHQKSDSEDGLIEKLVDHPCFNFTEHRKGMVFNGGM